MMRSAVCLGTAFLIAVPLAAPVHSLDVGVAGIHPPQAAALLPGPQEGIASWYGEAFHGLETATGETYNMNLMTAAHRRFPIGSLVRVVNLTNNKAVLVRINDRGPWCCSAIIDLSRAAARQLGMERQGRARVRLEPLALRSVM
jgi:rare lipoprotein A (peptidoglycan hydrolase)